METKTELEGEWLDFHSSGGQKHKAVCKHVSHQPFEVLTCQCFVKLVLWPKKSIYTAVGQIIQWILLSVHMNENSSFACYFWFFVLFHCLSSLSCIKVWGLLTAFLSWPKYRSGANTSYWTPTDGWQMKGKTWKKEWKNITRGHKGLLKSLLSVKMRWIICFTVTRSQPNSFWSKGLDIVQHQHHQNTKWGNYFCCLSLR